MFIRKIDLQNTEFIEKVSIIYEADQFFITDALSFSYPLIHHQYQIVLLFHLC